MRERVLEAIYGKLDKNPDDINLQKQIILLGKSNICTIHSFCLDVIRNNFFEVDLSANFRIGNEEEIELLKQEVLEDLFEELYEEEVENFIELVSTYTDYRGDENLKELILKIYNYIQSAPFPEEWLEEKVNDFKNTYAKRDFSETIWGEILIKNIKEELTYCIKSLKLIKERIDNHIELEKYSQVLNKDIEVLKRLYCGTEEDWDTAYEMSNLITFDRWPTDKKITINLKEEAKELRDKIKDRIMKLRNKTLIYNSKNAFKDIYAMYNILENLKKVILEFDVRFKNKKREKNIVDFNDIEHYALKILVKKVNGEELPTEVAKKYQEKFEEIAIDEYQDSNKVQELILKSISRENNIFMVGDVKQSIYKFRQACPELFLDKYNNYSLNGNEYGLKIQLFKNFRSRKNVLDVTNAIFESIMGKELGGIDYTKEEYLNLGAEYDETEQGIGNAELHLIELGTCEQTDTNEEDIEIDNNIATAEEKVEIEAKFVAKKIEELINSKAQVNSKLQGSRNIEYRDIVILLRSTSKVAPIYENELIKKNIPVFSDASNKYLDTIEIQTIMNLLKVLDNPTHDIPLVSLLRSKMWNFTDNEIIEIRLADKENSFYNSLILAIEEMDGELKQKISNFLNKLEEWRKESEILSLAELIWKIYLDTGFYNYTGLMPNGSLRQANLKMLFERAKEYEKTSFKGIFNFIRFIERIKITNGDMSSAKIIGENENVVRIMSIHKSKGLEFPVVFLSGASKKANMQDLQNDILLHQDIGIGPEYINYERRIEYPTVAKEAIKIVMEEEIIAEEMRILYVALTRAKEKLIITGTVKDFEENKKEKEDNLKIYDSRSGKINFSLIKKYKSYLDWILFVIADGKMDNILKLNIHKKEELIEEEKEREVSEREFDFEKETDFEELEKELNWEYPRIIATKLPIKTTVSKIKEMQNDDIDFDKIKEKAIGIENVMPSFFEENTEKIKGNIKGTLMHLFLQKIDFTIDYNMEILKEIKEELIAKKVINENESDAIDLNKILDFLNSTLAKNIRNSKKIEKEKAFCIKVNANEFYKEAVDETILVQGIIDLYFIDENDNIVLVDYKTDYIKSEQEIVNKYKVQLAIYKKALEQGLEKKVAETYIYSMYLNKEIKVEI